MCLLTYFPCDTQPDTVRLMNGSVVNSDGHGWGVVIPGVRVMTGFSMDARTAVDEFAEVRAQFPQGAALFHSRFTTHGLTNIDNCHPFPVNGDPRTVLGHNGILPHSAQPTKGDPRSDTAILAASIMRHSFPALDSKRTRRRFESWLGGNKIVILTVDPQYKAQAYIFNERLGTWKDGVWYSNDAWMPPFRYTSGTYTSDYSSYDSWYASRHGATSTDSLTEEDMELCDWCSEMNIDCACGRVASHSYGSTARRLTPEIDAVDDPDSNEYWDKIMAARVCPVCKTTGRIDAATDFCGSCLSCTACERASGTCLCYQPGSRARASIERSRSTGTGWGRESSNAWQTLKATQDAEADFTAEDLLAREVAKGYLPFPAQLAIAATVADVDSFDVEQEQIKQGAVILGPPAQQA